MYHILFANSKTFTSIGGPGVASNSTSDNLAG